MTHAEAMEHMRPIIIAARTPKEIVPLEAKTKAESAVRALPYTMPGFIKR